MATKWYVKTERSVRGPLSFQDVAFLIKDQQIPEDGLVRKEDEGDWQTADSVVGLLRAARKHPGLAEDLGAPEEFEEPEMTLPEVPSGRKPNRGSQGRLGQDERTQLLQRYREESDQEPVIVEDRRTFLQQAAIWGPVGVIATAAAYAAYIKMTYDPWANKKFED